MAAPKYSTALDAAGGCRYRRAVTRELRALVEGLAPEDAQVLSFDFSIMNSLITTGLVFKAYAGGFALNPVDSGGRYDPSLPALRRWHRRCRRRALPFRSSAWSRAYLAEDAASDGDNAAGRGAEGPLRIAVPKGLA